MLREPLWNLLLNDLVNIINFHNWRWHVVVVSVLPCFISSAFLCPFVEFLCANICADDNCFYSVSALLNSSNTFPSTSAIFHQCMRLIGRMQLSRHFETTFTFTLPMLQLMLRAPHFLLFPLTNSHSIGLVWSQFWQIQPVLKST